MTHWLKIDWRGFGRTEPWDGYLSDRVRAAASDLAHRFALPLAEAVALVWKVLDPEVHPYPDIVEAE